MTAASFLPLAKVSYAEDPPSARVFRWTHLTQNLTLTVGRWAGLDPNTSGQSLGIFQGQSTLIAINVEEMIRGAHSRGAASDKAGSGLVWSQSSLSAVYLYPAIALSYCTQQNMVRRVQVKFHTVSDFGIVYDFLQRVKCPLSRWSRQLNTKNVTCCSAEESSKYEIRQSASQQAFSTVNSQGALGNGDDISINCSQTKPSLSQTLGEGPYDAQLSYNLSARGIPDIPTRPVLHSAISTQETMSHGPFYTHSSQNHVANLATDPSTFHYGANAGTHNGLPSTAPPALSCSHQVGNGGQSFQMPELSTPHGEQMWYTTTVKDLSNIEHNEHQDDQVREGIRASQENGSPNRESDKSYPPRRELPWLRPRPRSSVADLPPLLTPQLASKVTKSKQSAAGKLSSSPIAKRVTKNTGASSTATRRSQAKSQTPAGNGSPKKTTQKSCAQNNSSGSKLSKGNKDDASRAEGHAIQKSQPPKVSYKDTGTETDKQSVVDRLYSLLNCDAAQGAANNKTTPTLAAYARQTASERAAIVNHMVAEALYDPYFATLCNDMQMYLKDLNVSSE